MARVAWVLLLLAAACSANPANRIVGGTPASIEEFQYMVQVEKLILFSVWTQRCAGTILTSRYVLSAAQCFAEPLARPQVRRIRAGSTYRNNGGEIRDVARFFNHPSFGQNGWDGDITVVLLETPLVYSNTIGPGTIISQGGFVPDNLAVTHVGWGRTSFFGDRAEDLTKVTVTTINNAVCAERYTLWPRPRPVTNNMICAGVLDGAGDGTCFGDAGGPLIYNDIVIGIASWGVTCANGTFPDVSTAVSSYTDWIIQTAT